MAAAGSPSTAVITLLPAVILFCFAAVLVRDNRRFVVRRYEVKAPGIGQPVRFVFLADLHNKVYGDDNSAVFEAVEANDPDAVLIGGDCMVYRDAVKGRDCFTDALALIRKIAGRWPTYYVNGNHEQHLLEDRGTRHQYEAMMEELRKAGVTILNNKRTVLAGKDGKSVEGLCLQGLALPMDYYERFRFTKLPDGAIRALIGEKPEGLYTVLLAHTPDQLEAYAAWGADLCLCGHLHGGVARLPLIGGVIGPQTGLFPRISAGRLAKDRPEGGKCEMIVSSGLGMHKLPVRFYNPGELTVVDLKKENYRS